VIQLDASHGLPALGRLPQLALMLTPGSYYRGLRAFNDTGRQLDRRIQLAGDYQ
jgi:hypothetical protein